MTFSRSLGLTLAVALLAACAEEAEQTGEMADSIRAESERALSRDTVGADDAAMGEMQTTVVMNEVGASGLGGEAMIAAGGREGQTSVRVSLTATGNGTGVHQGHIHRGTCAEIGGVVIPLEPVTTSGGTGTATSTVDADLMSIMDGGHIVVYHQADQQPGSPAVCGEIPGHVM